MKKLILAVLAFGIYQIVSAQFVATMEIKDNDTISGLCNRKAVYAIFPVKGQEEAVCSTPKETIEKRLNDEVTFLKENTKYTDKGMISVIINCKGQVARWEMDNKTKLPELDKQIITVCNTLTEWKPGKVGSKDFDSVVLWSFEIKKGKLSLE